MPQTLRERQEIAMKIVAESSETRKRVTTPLAIIHTQRRASDIDDKSIRAARGAVVSSVADAAAAAAAAAAVADDTRDDYDDLCLIASSTAPYNGRAAMR